MKVARTGDGLRREIAEMRRRGESIGFVPTMGALHEGHLSLVGAARDRGDAVVLSIFVNPLQFGPAEDLEAYPRDEERDLAEAEAAGVGVAFVPRVEEIYPPGATTTVSAPDVGRTLEGEARPGHFDGVCTVLSILFNLVGCDRAYFGQKDAQQVAVVRRMVADLGFGCDIVVCPTVREPDGIALSSRNAYLSHSDRIAARALYRALEEGRERLLEGEGSEAAEKNMWEVLVSQDGVVPEYARVVDPDTFEAPSEGRRALLVVAARVGATRVIDNMVIEATVART